MNKIGIHYGSFVTHWMENQLSLIPKVKEMGFDLLEFGGAYLLSLTDGQIARFRETAEEEGIALVVSLGLTPEQDIGSPRQAFRDAGGRILKDVASAMVKVGASDCSGIVHGSWNGKISRYEEKGAYWQNSVASMREAAKTFEDLGVYFNVEVVNRFENFLINSCDEALRYLEEVGSDNLGIHLDTFHMNIEEDSMVQAITKARHRLRYFHAGENNRKFPGLGSMPWKMIFDSLKAIGYKHPITLEAFVKPGGEVGSAVSLYRPMMDLEGYDSRIRNALVFIRGLLE